MPRKIPLDARQRLSRIKEIIDVVDMRCMAADGPVTETIREITPQEIKEIYRLACFGKKNK